MAKPNKNVTTADGITVKRRNLRTFILDKNLESVIFNNTEGWAVSKMVAWQKYDTHNLSSEDLSDASIAATYLQYRTGIAINSHPLALGWTELIRAESASVAPTDYLLLTQLVVFLIVTLVYGWRAWRYEGL